MHGCITQVCFYCLQGPSTTCGGGRDIQHFCEFQAKSFYVHESKDLANITRNSGNWK